MQVLNNEFLIWRLHGVILKFTLENYNDMISV